MSNEMKILGTDLWVKMPEGKLMRLVDGQWVELDHDGIGHIVFKNQSFTSLVLNTSQSQPTMNTISKFTEELNHSRRNNLNPDHPVVCVVGWLDYDSLVGELRLMIDGVGFKENSRIPDSGLEVYGVKVFKAKTTETGFYFGYQ